jgi:hypothetical protein
MPRLALPASTRIGRQQWRRVSSGRGTHGATGSTTRPSPETNKAPIPSNSCTRWTENSAGLSGARSATVMRGRKPWRECPAYTSHFQQGVPRGVGEGFSGGRSASHREGEEEPARSVHENLRALGSARHEGRALLKALSDEQLDQAIAALREMIAARADMVTS